MLTDSELSLINVRAPTVGMTERVRSERDQRPISSRKVGFVPNGYFLSGTYK